MPSSPASETTTPQTTFSLFSSLAPELRLKIWQYAACTPRLVPIIHDLERDICLTSSRPPAILQVCHEARDEALRAYTLSFGTRSAPARIYFNPCCDTLYLPRHRIMGYDDTLRDFRSFIIEGERACMDEVTSVAIDHVDVEAKRPWEAYNKAAFLRSFPKLKEVILVLREGRRQAALEADLELVEPRRPPEQLMDIWDEFWQGFNMEEKLLEDACRAMGKKYTKWKVPTFQIKARPSKALIVDNGPRTHNI